MDNVLIRNSRMSVTKQGVCITGNTLMSHVIGDAPYMLTPYCKIPVGPLLESKIAMARGELQLSNLCIIHAQVAQMLKRTDVVENNREDRCEKPKGRMKHGLWGSTGSAGKAGHERM